MSIRVLSNETINQIAAGEVIERPLSIVKELLENAIDAGSSSVSIEIREGGISLVRITDNGCGIEKEEVKTAFLRHATSKIRDAGDLDNIHTLGFRGEALASIAAVSNTEMITRRAGSLTAVHYIVDGGIEKEFSEIGAPEGTTIIVRDLFKNVPARKKFLKSAQTEAGKIQDIVEKEALAHPEVAFRFMIDGKQKLATLGNGSLLDVIYSIYGREVTDQLFTVNDGYDRNELTGTPVVSIRGYLGKPVITRANRSFEIYFVNGRFVKNPMITKAIEDGYRPFLMMHKFPFTVFSIDVNPEIVDVNVHPQKMEVRFSDGMMIYNCIIDSINKALHEKELIVAADLKENEDKSRNEEEKQTDAGIPKLPHVEPFEEKRVKAAAEHDSGFTYRHFEEARQSLREKSSYGEEPRSIDSKPAKPEQQSLFQDRFLSEKAQTEHRIIGQLFETYWLIEYGDKLYIIDQHAAHEKVNFERMMEKLKDKSPVSQYLAPPVLLTLSAQESLMLDQYEQYFAGLGYEISSLGGHDYSVSAVPADLPEIGKKELLIEMLDELSDETGMTTPETIYYKIASMSCKAAVKGKNHLSLLEAQSLIAELLSLDNPYACPHGRPTIISVSKTELEKKFKRIV